MKERGEAKIWEVSKAKGKDGYEGKGRRKDGDEPDERRINDGKCFKCNGFCKEKCGLPPQKCNYLGCLDPEEGHPTRACYQIMKRCRLEICDDQRGHHSRAHRRPDLCRLPGPEAARQLKEAYRQARIFLWEKEKEVIREYEEKKEERRKEEEERFEREREKKREEKLRARKERQEKEKVQEQ